MDFLLAVFLLAQAQVSDVPQSAAQTAPAGAPAEVTQAQQVETPEPLYRTEDGESLVCRNIQRLGTRFPTRRCTTRAVEEAQSEAVRQTMHDLTRPGRTEGSN